MCTTANTVRPPPPLVLVVEDDPDTVAMLTLCLEMSGFRVAKAMTGNHALSLLTDTPPDIAVADIGLPDMNGLEFCRRLRQHPVAHSIPTIAVTGWVMAEDVQRALTAGYNTVLPKPCSPQHLLDEIERLLSRPESPRCAPGQ